MKILTTDFDNTFYTIDFEENIEKVKKFVDDGNIFIIATGRNINSLRDEIDYYNIPFSYLICNDGAIIYDKYYQPIYQNDINPNIVFDVFDMLSKEKYIGEVFIDNCGFLSVDVNKNANKIIARPYDYKKAQILLNKIEHKFPSIYGYISDNWINIVDIESTKGNALKYVVNLNNYDENNIYTIGDNINDVSMNKLYKGYAVKDGNDELIKISKKTVRNFEELIEMLNKNLI